MVNPTTLITIFGRLNYFNSSRGGLKLVQYIKVTKMCLKVGKLMLEMRVPEEAGTVDL